MLRGFRAEVRVDPVLLVEDFNIGNLLFQIEVGSWLFPFTQGSWTKRPLQVFLAVGKPLTVAKSKAVLLGLWVFFPTRTELLLLHHARFCLLELILPLIHGKVNATFPSEAIPYLVVL